MSLPPDNYPTIRRDIVTVDVARRIQTGWYSIGDNTFAMWVPGGLMLQCRLTSGTAMQFIPCSAYDAYYFLSAYGVFS